MDNNTLNKYDLSSGKNIVVVDNVKLGIINSTCINSKMYFQIASTVNDEGDVLEFDFNTENQKSFSTIVVLLTNIELPMMIKFILKQNLTMIGIFLLLIKMVF